MAMVFEACVPEFEKLYLDLLNGAIFFFGFFQILWVGTSIFFRLRAFLVLGRFGALGPPITVLTKIQNGVISRPKSIISRPKSVKTNQGAGHSLAAKTPSMKRRYFWKKQKIFCFNFER